MTDRRFGRQLPALSASATPVQFPRITRDELASGLQIWSLPWHSMPVATVALLIERGAVQDPADRHGLASLTADLVDEGAGGRDAVQLSEAFERLGTHLDVEAGHDTTSLSLTTLARNLEAAMTLLADVVIRPHLLESDLARIRELRINRLRQLRTSASAVADRAFLQGVFGRHPYGHGSLGTTRSLEALSLDDVRDFHGQAFVGHAATLVVVGDVEAGAATAMARRLFRDWAGGARRGRPAVPSPEPQAPRCFLVDRPGAPQSELRVGQLGPPRRSDAYHALVTLNAALGGQFTSRINQQLREAKGYTYGARTSFDFHWAGSTFGCDTSVQSNATAEALTDVLSEFAAVGSTRPVAGVELESAKSSLTRGYVRHFETPAHLVRAAAELLKFELPVDSFDRFVPAVSALGEGDILSAARRYLRPAECVVAVVGDAEQLRTRLSSSERVLVEITPEF